MRRSALAVLSAAAMVLVFASSAHAAASWNEGPVERSYIDNCISYGFPTGPVVEEGAWTWTGQYLDPANPPNVGETFYVNVVAGAVGNACGGQHVHFELLGLPVAGMATNVDPVTRPIICWAINWNTNPPSAQQEPQWPAGSCPQLPINAVFNAGNGVSLDAQTNAANDEAPWPLPQGRGWEIQVPVTVDHALHGGFGNCNDCNRFDTWIIDGNSSPQLIPHQGLFVEDVAGGTPGGGGSPGGTVGGTAQGLTAGATPVAPAAAATGERAAALKKCKKKKGSKRKKCKKKAQKLPV
jgi:hypothetical protein